MAKTKKEAAIQQQSESEFTTIATLKTKIEIAVDDIKLNISRTIERSWELGSLLNDYKQVCEHGEFMPYVESLGIGHSWAANIMRIAKFYTLEEIREQHHTSVKGYLQAIQQNLLPAKKDELQISKPLQNRSSVSDGMQFMSLTKDDLHQHYQLLNAKQPQHQQGDTAVWLVKSVQPGRQAQPCIQDGEDYYVVEWSALVIMLNYIKKSQSRTSPKS